MNLSLNIVCVASYYKPAYIYGGPTRSVAALCQGMQRAGANVTVFTTNADGSRSFLNVPVGQPLGVDGVNVTYFPVLNPIARLFPFYSPALHQACKKHMREFDLVYIVGNWTHSVLVAAQSAYRGKTPYVISPRGSLMDYCMDQKALKKQVYLTLIERKLIERSAALHLSSQLEEIQLRKLNFHRPTVIIPNPVDIATFERLPSRGALRSKLGWPSDALITLYVGRLHKQKRISLMIEAFAQVSRQNPDARLLIVGSDEDGSGYASQHQARCLGISDKVHFTGLLKGKELLQAYADSDLLVLFSCSESFGMVVAEAMAAGLPVLISDEVGLAAEAQEAGAGLAVPAVVDEAARAWAQMLKNRNCLNQMGMHGKLLAQKNFSIDRISGAMIKFFSNILKSKN